VLVACVQGEEDGGLGTFAMLRRGWRADACVIPEPTGLDLVVAEGRLGVALDEPAAAAREALEVAVAEACRTDPWLAGHPVGVEWWGGQFAPRPDAGRQPAGGRRAAGPRPGRPGHGPLRMTGVPVFGG
jgi:hypothetical protein